MIFGCLLCCVLGLLTLLGLGGSCLVFGLFVVQICVLRCSSVWWLLVVAFWIVWITVVVLLCWLIVLVLFGVAF